MSTQLIRRLPPYDILADDNRDPSWMEFVAQIDDGDEVWECRFTSDGSHEPRGLVMLRDGVEIATYPPDPSRRFVN